MKDATSVVLTYKYIYRVNLQTITDIQLRVELFIVFKCCGLLEKLDRNFPHKERGGVQLKISNRTPFFVIPHIEGFRKIHKTNGGFKKLIDHSIQNGG